jgi:hypothetical protein
MGAKTQPDFGTILLTMPCHICKEAFAPGAVC